MSEPCRYKNSFGLFPLYVVLTLLASDAYAQDLNDEMKKRLLESAIKPELNFNFVPEVHTPKLFNEQPEVLKVSPYTKLPTRFDRLNLLVPPRQEVQINFNTKVPINQRPPGSTRFEFVGNRMMIIPTGGQIVTPSGMDSGPIRKRHKKGENILKAFEK